ncbi:MAG: restriction endonuclease subunit S [Maritimibacter sp.]|nr:restriction endonuclease subunit S [Maritimibacter sp.]
MGFTARARLTKKRNGWRVVQLSDLSPNGRIRAADVQPVDVNEPGSAHQLRDGDVVFRSRGASNIANDVVLGVDDVLAVAAPLMILRPEPTKILGRYLAWAINSASAQAYFERNAQGTGVRMISKATLTQLTIPVPPLQTQARIVEIDDLSMREEALQVAIATARRNLVGHLLGQVATGQIEGARQ